jgi:hypothetical protein
MLINLLCGDRLLHRYYSPSCMCCKLGLGCYWGLRAPRPAAGASAGPPRGHPTPRRDAQRAPGHAQRAPAPYFMWAAVTSSAGRCQISCEYGAFASSRSYGSFTYDHAPRPEGTRRMGMRYKRSGSQLHLLRGGAWGGAQPPAPHGRAREGVPLACSPGVSRAQIILKGARGRVPFGRGTRRLACSPGVSRVAPRWRRRNDRWRVIGTRL